jgi:S1-C subfamily serine protease
VPCSRYAWLVIQSPSPETRARYIAILALVSGFILIVGWLMRPGERNAAAPPPVSETDLARLARLTQRRSLENMTDYFETLATDVGTSLQRLPNLQETALVWTSDLIVTAQPAWRAPDEVTVSGQGAELQASVVASGPQLPLAAYEVAASSDLVPARRAEQIGRSGSWIVAVWQTNTARTFAPANLLHASAVTCGEVPTQELVSTLTLTRAMAGGGLFDIDGYLLAVILSCDGRMAAITIGEIDAMLRSARTLAGRLLGRYGLRIDAPTVGETAYLETEGRVIVREVWVDYPAARAGLAPGDIIRALNGADVLEPGDLQVLAAPRDQEPLVLSVQTKGSPPRDVKLWPLDRSNAPEEMPVANAGLVWASAPQGYPIDAVSPASQAAQAGIQSGDRLLRVDGVEPRTKDQAGKLLSGSRTLPAFVEIERHGRRWGVLLQ